MLTQFGWQSFRETATYICITMVSSAIVRYALRVYRDLIKKINPRIEPCGIHATVILRYVMTTKWFWASKHDLNHLRTVSWNIPTQFSSLARSGRWSIVSKAALKSSNTKTETLPDSVFSHMYLYNIQEVSVLWIGRETWMKFVKISYVQKNIGYCRSTIFS